MNSAIKNDWPENHNSKIPLVSILAPCYNTAKYLQPFLDSVLQQTYRNIELIVVDDASTDGTLALLLEAKKSFEDNGIPYKVLSRPQNGGAAAALNLGLTEFAGDYVMWVDSDDVLFETNVEDKVRMLENHPECGFVLAEGIIIDADDRSRILKRLRRHVPTGDDTLFEDLISEKNVVYGPGTIMVRREALLRAIPQRRIFESPEGQNYQLLLPLAYRERCCYLEKPLFACVSHKDSHSRKERDYEQLQKRQSGLEALIDETISAIPGITSEDQRYWQRFSAATRATRRLDLAFSFNRKDDVHTELQNLADLGYRAKPWQKSRILWVARRKAIRARNLIKKATNMLGANR